MTEGLTGKRVLIVEDDYLIASDLDRALRQQGAVVLGPVARLDQGLSLAKEEIIDVALLDVNLNGAKSFPIADALSERGIPHLFLTGYDDWALPEPYQADPRMTKPFAVGMVAERLEKLVAKPLAQPARSVSKP